ncbi:hypothetical protein QJS10_CPB04g00535 [Acorus calamus]|uniref:50S ribosomal protein 5, chloroplastic n=1 Tax=Acorus calamus TaxID=4465 RepID=A0AAV9EZ29_ACOCL|nr:hypothetical protein QJS10_CPB04g00520 [Acorus calamus]KAK1318981.1 hypothetical protein QJS10_CPB04g00535 [Acorus calamus]
MALFLSPLPSFLLSSSPLPLKPSTAIGALRLPRLPRKNLTLQPVPSNGFGCPSSFADRARKMPVIALATSDNIDAKGVESLDLPSEGGSEEVVSVENLPLESKKQMILEQRLKMKLAKKLRLRRKRLVRKRHLRKKGRWPPSKMKKNKNV